MRDCFFAFTTETTPIMASPALAPKLAVEEKHIILTCLTMPMNSIER